MKKIFTILFVGLTGLALNAQRSGVTNRTVQTPSSSQPKVGDKVFRAERSGSRSNSYWMNYALQLDDPAGYSPQTAAASLFLIFPDSNIIIGQYTSGATAYAQFHKAGTMLDPKNMPVQGISSTSMYSLDSLAIAYAYTRTTASTEVDTLVIQIFKNDASLEYTLAGPPSVTYQDITYVQSTNSITQSQVLATYTYLLTEADSSLYTNEIAIATPGIANQPGTNRIGAVVSFKPGYTWTSTDSIYQKNGFYLLTYEQNGANTDPTYYGTSGDGTSDMNFSSVLPTDVRYGINANGWNGYFIPVWAWTTPFAYEHHIIEFHINELLGVTENSNVSMTKNYPNPADNSENISYSLKSESNIALTISDITGKTIMTQNEGHQMAGDHNTAINTSSLADGVYMITLTCNEGKVMSKLVVQH